MPFDYLLEDEKGNVGSSIALIQGESKTITLWLFEISGIPYQELTQTFTPTPADIVVKVYSQINQASIVKKLSLSQVTKLMIGSMIVGIQFALSTTDTPMMAANNSGLPMKAIFTDTTGNVSEFDIAAAFSVSVPVLQT